MLTFLIFIIVLGVLVLVHEWGHFIMARRAGMKVEEFGFGFPPRLFGIRKGETVYTVNLIPFGGFVKILGEDGGERENLRSFGSKSIFARFRVITAGVTMNLIFAIILMMFVNYFGLRVGLFSDDLLNVARDKKLQITEVVPESPAQKADLRILDEIAGFTLASGEIVALDTIKEVQEFTSQHKGEILNINIRRGDEIVTKEVLARENPPDCQGSMGISMALTGVVSYPWYEAIWRGFYDAFLMVINTIYGFYLILNPPDIACPLNTEVSGPIGIASITGQAFRVGFGYLIQFVALISINLAILNIIPFPALDGGRALFLIIEKIKGSPIDKRIEITANNIGFILLFTLLIYITIKDIGRFFTG